MLGTGCPGLINCCFANVGESRRERRAELTLIEQRQTAIGRAVLSNFGVRPFQVFFGVHRKRTGKRECVCAVRAGRLARPEGRFWEQNGSHQREWFCNVAFTHGASLLLVLAFGLRDERLGERGLRASYRRSPTRRLLERPVVITSSLDCACPSQAVCRIMPARMHVIEQIRSRRWRNQSGKVKFFLLIQ